MNPGLNESIAAPSAFYMYAEQRLGEVPTPAMAQQLLADIDARKVYIHGTINTGWRERLETIVAGGLVEPHHFGA